MNIIFSLVCISTFHFDCINLSLLNVIPRRFLLHINAQTGEALRQVSLCGTMIQLKCQHKIFALHMPPDVIFFVHIFFWSFLSDILYP